MCNGLDKCKIYEPSKEEKLENVLTNVSTRLLSKKNHLLKNGIILKLLLKN